MTKTGLTATVASLWLMLALIILLVATSAPHFSPLEFIIPQLGNPVSLISSTLLYGPPVLLAVAHLSPPNVSKTMLWVLATVLALAVAAIFVVPIASAILRN